MAKKNSKKQHIKNPIDFDKGKFTFGHRIELGTIMQDENTSEVEKFELIIRCLHGFTPKPKQYEDLIPYFNDICNGLKKWAEMEAQMLNNEPTDEELQAGVKEFMRKVGEFGTVKSIAKAYSKDPDEVLNWEYAKVFGILFTDLEESKFQRRLNKVIENKYKSKSK